MPIYEYRCKCGREKEITLSFNEYDKTQVCECGEVMARKISLPQPAIIVPTGKQMALDTLNAKPHEGGMPHRHWTERAEQAAAAGLERPPKKIW
jgi:putative FmdB family regulatory protein